MTTKKTKPEVAEAAVEEKVTVRRSRAKKSAEAASAADAAPQAATEAPAEVKPRRRRVVKKEAEVVADAAVEAPVEAKAVEKPKRARKTVKKAAAASEETPEAVAEPAAEAKKSARRPRGKKAPEAPAPQEEAVALDVAEVREQLEPAAEKMESAVAATEEKPEGAEAAGRPDRKPLSRTLRRRRRTGDRDGRDSRDASATRSEAQAGAEAPQAPAVVESTDDGSEKAFCSDKVFDPQVFSRGKKAQKDALMAQSEKLQKVLADAGLGSRRDMEQLILEGRISVNGTPAYIGQRVMPADVVKINGRVVKQAQSSGGVKKTPRVLAYHKPVGEIVSMDDPEGRPTVFDHLPKVSHGRWIAVGRLDFNTEGLLLFTTSGELANRLMHPRYAIEREYAVRAAGVMTEEGLKALTTGVELEDGPAAFSKVEEKGGEGVNRWYLVRINEGRNREVRRMFAAVGLTVSRLIRVRYGAVQLPKDLDRGATKELPADWVRAWMADLEAAAPVPNPHVKKSGGKGDAKKFGKFGGGKNGKKNGKKGRGDREFQRIPDPMTSTVNYIASGQLDQAQRVYSRGLADNGARGSRDFGRGDGIKGNRRFSRGGRGR